MTQWTVLTQGRLSLITGAMVLLALVSEGRETSMRGLRGPPQSNALNRTRWLGDSRGAPVWAPHVHTLTFSESTAHS